MDRREKGLKELIGREEGRCKTGEGGWKLPIKKGLILICSQEQKTSKRKSDLKNNNKRTVFPAKM